MRSLKCFYEAGFVVDMACYESKTVVGCLEVGKEGLGGGRVGVAGEGVDGPLGEEGLDYAAALSACGADNDDVLAHCGGDGCDTCPVEMM